MTPPVLRVVGGGDPTDEELAALVAVLSLTRARAEPGEQTTAPSRWARSARPAPASHSDGWLASARRSSLRGGR